MITGPAAPTRTVKYDAALLLLATQILPEASMATPLAFLTDGTALAVPVDSHYGVTGADAPTVG